MNKEKLFELAVAVAAANIAAGQRNEVQAFRRTVRDTVIECYEGLRSAWNEAEAFVDAD
jgi:hypothetical protein